VDEPTFPTPGPLTPAEFERVVAALGPASQLAYAPPHVYPMSAPAFVKRPGAERERLSGNALGVYIHIPFCNYACTFCFYAKRIGDDHRKQERYVRALEQELSWVEPGTRLSQLYVGGGTPTALPEELLDRALLAVFDRMSGGGIHTVECSPESISQPKLAVLKARGIGRVSMGIQTLDERVLEQVGRRHSAEQALAACDELVDSGMTINVDLMYGLPEQSEAAFRQDFESVAARGVHSVTVYNLRLNERTPVARTLRDTERLGLARLMRWRFFVKCTAEELGFRQTRWHLFQRAETETPRTRFEDNTGVGSQFGIGMSARTRLGATIYRNHPELGVYLERVESGQSPVEEIFSLEKHDRKTRFIAQSLGDGKRLERELYEREFGDRFDDEFAEPLKRLREAGLIVDDGRALSFSEIGKLVHDLATLTLYPDHVRAWLQAREETAVSRGKLLPIKS
jgi:oxygen-independent coproporphyrinogen III oxidase